jgi:putative serine protease PepD
MTVAAIRRMRLLPFVLGLAVAAVVGGVVGGLIVRTTWDADDDDVGTSTAAAACRAADVADEALPSVVTVSVSNGAQGASGSGVVIRSGGYVLTNEHVVSLAVQGGTVSIMRSDGGTAEAKIIGSDQLTDLSVIKVDGSPDLPVIRIGQSRSLRVGEPVVALGSPLGLASTVTSGIVSALDRYVRVPGENGQAAHLVDAVQTDASINPGNSGGALVDCAARLVGINSAGAALPSSGGGSIGLGFAIPIDLAMPLADELIANGKVSHLTFGMQVQAIPQEQASTGNGSHGLFVHSLTPGGPADKAGLRPGDVLVEVDGQPATDVDALVVKTLEMSAGDTVKMTYQRAGASATVTLTLAPLSS